MSGDNLLSLISWSVSLALLVTLWIRRVNRALPVFYGFLVFELLLGMASRAMEFRAPQRTYLIFWIVTAYIDAAFDCAVLVELGRDLLPRGGKFLTHFLSAAVLFGLVLAILFRLIQWHLSPRPMIWRYTTHAVQLTSIIELAAYLGLMMWASLARLHWSKRAISIVSGIGFYCVFDFVIAIVFSYPGVRGSTYRWLGYLPPVIGIGVNLYWLQCFLFEHPVSAGPGERSTELVAAGHSDDESLPDRRDSAALFRLFIRSPK